MSLGSNTCGEPVVPISPIPPPLPPALEVTDLMSGIEEKPQPQHKINLFLKINNKNTKNNKKQQKNNQKKTTKQTNQKTKQKNNQGWPGKQPSCVLLEDYNSMAHAWSLPTLTLVNPLTCHSTCSGVRV